MSNIELPAVLFSLYRFNSHVQIPRRTHPPQPPWDHNSCEGHWSAISFTNYIYEVWLASFMGNNTGEEIILDLDCGPYCVRVYSVLTWFRILESKILGN